ncbi:MAG: fibrobacter succinogenes major paralogous domain-containing protein [Ferruginibacter sp.]
MRFKFFPFCYVIFAIVFISSCKKNDDDEPQKTTATTYNCINGNCETAGTNGAYSNLSNCQNNCGFIACPSSITDSDGNSYPVVQIGDQFWTAENLKTTRFADGSVIPNVTSVDAWINLSTPAWCNYENNEANDSIYGKLYNWYTVADPRNLCPTGWHVPSDSEFTILIDFLGGDSIAGGKMKATVGWQTANNGATNESGFLGLPGGSRYSYYGEFFNVGNNGYWWSSSETSTTTAWYHFL